MTASSLWIAYNSEQGVTGIVRQGVPGELSVHRMSDAISGLQVEVYSALPPQPLLERELPPVGPVGRPERQGLWGLGADARAQDLCDEDRVSPPLDRLDDPGLEPDG